MSEVATQDQWSVSLELRNPELTYERYEEICGFLGVAHSEVRFAIGDAVLHGEERFGLLAYEAMERLQTSPEGLQEYARVSRKVPPSIRRKDVSWSHHRAVAAVEGYEEKKALLKRAATEQLSHHALRDVLRNGTEPKATESCPTCGRRL